MEIVNHDPYDELSPEQAAFLKRPHGQSGSMRQWLESTLLTMEEGPDSAAATAAEQLAVIDGQAELAGLGDDDMAAICGWVRDQVREY